MSTILSSILSAAGGVLAGLALAGALLWRQQRSLHLARCQANTDEVTGLPNRRAALAHLRAALRRGEHVAVALLDLDRFKTVNDTYGHAAGDDVLRQVADRLRRLPYPVRLAARLSGDEFVLVLSGDRRVAIAAAITALRAVAEPVLLSRVRVDVSASIGVAASAPGIDERRLLYHADMAMYQAKAAGGGIRAHTPHAGTGEPATRPRVRSRDRRHR